MTDTTDELSVYDKISKDFTASIFSGVIGGVTQAYMADVGVFDNFEVFGTNLPAIVVGGVPVMLGHLTGSVLEDFVLSKLPQSEYATRAESMLVKPGLAGAATYVVNRFAISEEVPLSNVIVGAGSVLASEYLVKNLGL